MWEAANYITPFDLSEKSQSWVLSAERTILSPFTKEYRTLGTTLTGIPFFLDRPFNLQGPP